MTVVTIMFVAFVGFGFIYLEYKMNKIQKEVERSQDSTRRMGIILLGLLESMAKVAKNNKENKDSNEIHGK